MTKGEEILKKKFNAEDIFGTKIISDSNLIENYLKTVEEKENKTEENEIDELIKKDFEETKNASLKDTNEEDFKTEELLGYSASELLKDFDYDEEEYYELLQSDDFSKLKIYTESDNYPESFPTIEELALLKLKYKELYLIKVVNYFEELNYDLKTEMFICTDFKSHQYFKYLQTFGSDENLALFYPFVISQCCLFPQIKAESVLDMPAGTVKQLADSILINSKYNVSCTINKL